MTKNEREIKYCENALKRNQKRMNELYAELEGVGKKIEKNVSERISILVELEKKKHGKT